jgi:glycosyltransferase involved in cell wall biosynthesis
MADTDLVVRGVGADEAGKVSVSPLRRRGRRDRPRVLIMVENLPLARDRRLGKQVRSLVRNGFDVTVVCRRNAGNRAVAAVDLVEYPAPRDASSKWGFVGEYGYSWLMAALAFLRVAARPGFDVLQLCGPPDIYFPFALLAKALGKPTVYDQRDPSPELYAARYGTEAGLMPRLLRLLESASYRSADHVVTVNETLEKLARTRGGVPADRVTIVRNGPELVATSDRPPAPELRNGRAHLCCWAGAMGSQDRLDLGVRSVHHLVRGEGRTDCQFAFLGDGEAQEEAMTLSRELGVEDWVSFPGFLSQDDVFTYLATADVGIDPGLDQTVSPVKAFEYMAFGLPIVAFDLRETRALAADAARYAAPGDVEGFAGLISDLLDDPEARGRLGRAGRHRVEAFLAWDHQEPLYIGAFDRVLGRRGAGGSGRVAVQQVSQAAADQRG